MFSLIRNYFKKSEPPTSESRQPMGAAPEVAPPIPEASAIIRQAIEAVGNQRFAEAANLYETAVSLRGNDVASQVGLGFSLLQLGQSLKAIEALERAIALDDKNVGGYYMLGKAYVETGQPEAAERAWSRTLRIDPKFEHVYCEYCLLLFSIGRLEAATRLIQTGISIYPGNAEFQFYLGNLMFESGDFGGACEAYQKAISMGAGSAELMSSFASALRQTGHLDQSIEVLSKAIAMAPKEPTIFSNHVLAIQYSEKFSKQQKFEAHVEFSKRFETELVDQWGGYTNDLSPNRKLRIGYVSGDLRNHSLAFFIEPVLARHDRTSFEIHCYHAHPTHDVISERLKKLTDHWNAVSALSDAELAQKIRADGIDILIDLSGHTGHNRLLVFARKPAPIQMTWLGYQATTGLRAVDFRITDEALDPTGTTEAFHSETLLRLPSSGTFAASPDSPPLESLPALKGQPFTFGCLNNPSKITEEVIPVWGAILTRLPMARLMIGNSSPEMVVKLSALFAEVGVAADRIVFEAKVPLIEYLALHNRIDVALDTFPYNGGTTTFHSLWMGVPIVALEGDASLSRVGVAIMRELGLPEFCAATKEEYIARAVHHATNLDALQAVRATLREKMSRSTADQAVVVARSLESALRTNWEDYCSRQTPRR